MGVGVRVSVLLLIVVFNIAFRRQTFSYFDVPTIRQILTGSVSCLCGLFCLRVQCAGCYILRHNSLTIYSLIRRTFVEPPVYAR